MKITYVLLLISTITVGGCKRSDQQSMPVANPVHAHDSTKAERCLGTYIGLSQAGYEFRVDSSVADTATVTLIKPDSVAISGGYYTEHGSLSRFSSVEDTSIFYWDTISYRIIFRADSLYISDYSYGPGGDMWYARFKGKKKN